MYRCLVVLVVAACGRVGFDATSDAAADAAPDAPLGPWGPATTVDVGLPAGIGVDDPTLTADRLLLVANLDFDEIGVSTRATTADAWSALTADPVLSTGAETEPHLSSDGLTIFFGSARTGTIGGFDIYTSSRASRAAAWSPPTRVAELSTTDDDIPGTMTADGLLIPVTRGNSPREIYFATRTSTALPWSAPVLATEISSVVDDDAGAHLLPDGLTLYFYSTRTGSEDLYVATRTSRSEPFDAPQPITDLNDVVFEEVDPWASPDQRHIVFASNRGPAYSLYEASR